MFVRLKRNGVYHIVAPPERVMSHTMCGAALNAMPFVSAVPEGGRLCRRCEAAFNRLEDDVVRVRWDAALENWGPWVVGPGGQ